ncbi:MAG: hypothetical protein PUH00_08740 [Clostridiales bacterium]|nr:hypothetical protein [Clostridiales bacterium]MDY4431103.1 hypothetical protein [Evtepia sp.]
MPQIDYFWRCVYLIHTILSEGICGGTYQNVIKIDRKKCTESTKTGESPALLPGIPFERKGNGRCIFRKKYHGYSGEEGKNCEKFKISP